ncbi:MAG: DUF721 domain-containing protein [Thermodesulfobacteriota bacterium]
MKRKHPRKRPPERLGAVLGEVFARLGVEATLSRHRIAALWPEIVQQSVARHAQVEGVAGSVLHVRVDSAVWMNELSALKITLLEKVNAKLHPDAAPFTDIRFFQRSWAAQRESPVPARTPEPPLPPPTEEDLALVQDTLQPISDEELRKILSRILEKDRRLRHRREDKPQR